MTYISSLILLLTTVLLPRLAVAAEPVYVAAYEYPPYFSSRVNKHIAGEVIKALNAKQDTYQYLLREVRPKDRYRALRTGGCCDLMLFEASSWGWATQGRFLWGEELTRGTVSFYTLAESLETGRTSFQPFRANKIGGVFGYHYKYTDMETAVETWESEFKMYSAASPDSLLTMLLHQRVDMVVLNDEYVEWQKALGRPGMHSVVGSELSDHAYLTQVVFNRNALKQASMVNRLLKEMKASGELAAIFVEFGLSANLILNEQEN